MFWLEPRPSGHPAPQHGSPRIENLLWQFHAGYPAGFSPAQEAAARFGAHLGVWLSPWGGYPCQPGRVAAGEKLGYQVDRIGLTLADPGYYLASATPAWAWSASTR